MTHFFPCVIPPFPGSFTPTQQVSRRRRPIIIIFPHISAANPGRKRKEEEEEGVCLSLFGQVCLLPPSHPPTHPTQHSVSCRIARGGFIVPHGGGSAYCRPRKSGASPRAFLPNGHYLQRRCVRIVQGFPPPSPTTRTRRPLFLLLIVGGPSSLFGKASRSLISPPPSCASFE